MVELKLHILAIAISPYACNVWQGLSRLHLKSRQQEAELQKKIQHQTKRKQKSKAFPRTSAARAGIEYQPIITVSVIPSATLARCVPIRGIANLTRFFPFARKVCSFSMRKPWHLNRPLSSQL